MSTTLVAPQERSPEAGDELLDTKRAAAVLGVSVASFWRVRRRSIELFPKPFYLTAHPSWSGAELLAFARTLRASGAES